MIQFYCYSRCSTCKKAKRFLENKNIEFMEKEITTHDLSPEDLKQLHERSNLPIRRLFNTSGNVYRELNLKDKIDTMPLEEAYQLLASNGMLIKRPILISQDHVFFGFKEEEYAQIEK